MIGCTMGNINIDPLETKPGQETIGEGEELTRNDADRIEAQANTNAVSRSIAIVILMLVPGVVGSYLDQWLGTKFIVVIGFIVGVGVSIFGLLYVARIADLAAKKSRERKQNTKFDSHSSRSERGHD